MNTECAGLKILLVDDSDDDRFLFVAAFRKSGISGQIIEKQDGDEAIEFLGQIRACAQTEWPHAIFLDLKMPRRDGFDVLRWVREKPALKLLPIFVLSGSHEPSDIQRAHELGVVDYIVKPIKAEKIRELLAFRNQST
jgi:CheY-like chemotaxis protein